MNLIQDTSSDWMVAGLKRPVYIHKNDDGTFTNSVSDHGGKGGHGHVVGTYPDMDSAYVAAQAM